MVSPASSIVAIHPLAVRIQPIWKGRLFLAPGPGAVIAVAKR
jgi:hypothetical protein